MRTMLSRQQVLCFLLLAASLRAQTPQNPQLQQQAAQAAMQASLDKQGAAVAAFSSALKVPSGSFFLLPPLPAPTITANAPVDCEPLTGSEVAPMVEDAARREDLDPRLITAVIEQESAFRPCAISQKGAQGVMQLMPSTLEELGVGDAFDVQQNIGAGAKYLKQLLIRYGGDVSMALGAYNAGPNRVDQTGGIPRIPETTAYVKNILDKLRVPAPVQAPLIPLPDVTPPTIPLSDR